MRQNRVRPFAKYRSAADKTDVKNEKTKKKKNRRINKSCFETHLNFVRAYIAELLRIKCTVVCF